MSNIDYRIGDLVRLSDFSKYKNRRVINRYLNVFEITDIRANTVTLKNIETDVLMSDIEPIPINGKDDFEIYYMPRIAANIVDEFRNYPARTTDESYYWEHFSRWRYVNGKTYQEIIKELGLKYVHEIQHFLSDKYLGPLKFNDY